jgi:hypothetical protein
LTTLPAVATATVVTGALPCPTPILPRPPRPTSPPSRTPISRYSHTPPVSGPRRSGGSSTTSGRGPTPTAPWRSTWSRRTPCTPAARPGRKGIGGYRVHVERPA